MVTVKDFAAQQGCGESIIYRHIRQHREALGDRVQKVHGKTWLTDEGAEYIRSCMKAAPVVVSEQSEELDRLRSENERLHLKLEEKQDRIELLQQQAAQFVLQASKIALLEADNESARAKAQESEKTAQEAQDALREAQAELDRLRHANLWQRLKGFR